MKDDKCGCENGPNKLNSEFGGCGCESEKYPNKKEKIAECGQEESSNTKEESCGCKSEDNPIAEENDSCGCGCGNIEYPDLSLIENPEQPKYLADDNFIQAFEDYAISIGIKNIGYSQITSELLIRDKFIQYPHVIVLTMEMNEKIVKTTPGAEAQELNDAAYTTLGELSYTLSDYIRKNGFASEVAHPYEGDVKFSQLAQKAGLGHIGKSGLLITPDLGPRQKISAIFVSIVNLPEKSQDYSWIKEYCERCSNCIKACEEKALIEKDGGCGNKEVELIKNRCIGCSQGCTYCIEQCPFYTKGYDHIKTKFDKMNAKLREKKCCSC